MKAKESEIQRCILDGLAAKRIFAFRLNTAAMKVGKRFFRAHSLGAGAADILALIPQEYCGGAKALEQRYQIALWIECKAEGGQVSLEQKVFAHWIEHEDRGHSYLIARSWEDVVWWLREHGV